MTTLMLISAIWLGFYAGVAFAVWWLKAMKFDRKGNNDNVKSY